MAVANGYANILRAYRTLAMQRVTLSSKVLVYEHQNWKIPSYKYQYWGVHWCDVKICHIPGTYEFLVLRHAQAGSRV